MQKETRPSIRGRDTTRKDGRWANEGKKQIRLHAREEKALRTPGKKIETRSAVSGMCISCQAGSEQQKSTTLTHRIPPTALKGGIGIVGTKSMLACKKKGRGGKRKKGGTGGCSNGKKSQTGRAQKTSCRGSARSATVKKVKLTAEW